MAHWTLAHFDPENEQIYLKRQTSAGTDTTDAQVVISLADADAVTGLPSGAVIKLREMPVCIGGVTKHIVMLCSAPY